MDDAAILAPISVLLVSSSRSLRRQAHDKDGGLVAVERDRFSVVSSAGLHGLPQHTAAQVTAAGSGWLSRDRPKQIGQLEMTSYRDSGERSRAWSSASSSSAF
jgi:hypothetical protein